MKIIKIIVTISILAGGILFIHSCKKKEKEYSVTSVKLDRNEIGMAEGDTAHLSCTVSPKQAKNRDVKWSITDPSIASVSKDGIVTALAQGDAIITVSSVEGNKKDYCELKVINTVTGVMLNKTQLTLKKSETATLIATVLPANAPNKKVSWKTGNTSVATVDQNGKVTAIATGTTTVTVTTDQNNKTAVCSVYVETTPVSSVSLDKTTLSMIEGETETLTAMVLPATATNKKVIWSSSNSSSVYVDQNGKLTALWRGEAVITATTEDGNKKATCKVEVGYVAVTGVTLNRSNKSIYLWSTNTDTLVSTVLPANAATKTVSYSVSDPTVLDIQLLSNGRCAVKAKKTGSATVTVTTQDGNKTASCTYNVIASEDVYAITNDGKLWKNGNIVFNFQTGVTITGLIVDNGVAYICGYSSAGSHIWKTYGNTLTSLTAGNQSNTANRTYRLHDLSKMGNRLYVVGEYIDSTSKSNAYIRYVETDNSTSSTRATNYNTSYHTTAYCITQDQTYFYTGTLHDNKSGSYKGDILRTGISPSLAGGATTIHCSTSWQSSGAGYNVNYIQDIVYDNDYLYAANYTRVLKARAGGITNASLQTEYTLSSPILKLSMYNGYLYAVTNSGDVYKDGVLLYRKSGAKDIVVNSMGVYVAGDKIWKDNVSVDVPSGAYLIAVE